MPERHRGQGCGRNRGMAPMRGGIRFLQTCLLVLLNQKKSYGYSLANELAQFGFSPGALDISIVYRALRGLEIEGLVSTSSDERSLGPQRRIYEITPQGSEVLSQLIEELKERKQEIEAIEAAYNAANKRHP